MEAVEKLYWTKVLLAVGVSAVCTLLQSIIQMSGFATFAFGLLMYLLLSNLLGRVFDIERDRALKIGVGAYFFTWLAVWTIAFTLLNTAR